MREIWKFPLYHPSTSFFVYGTEDHPPKVLDVQIQDTEFYAWVIHRQEDKEVTYQVDITIVGTGFTITDDIGEYVATVQDGALVWHFFAKIQRAD